MQAGQAGSRQAPPLLSAVSGEEEPLDRGLQMEGGPGWGAGWCPFEITRVSHGGWGGLEIVGALQLCPAQSPAQSQEPPTQLLCLFLPEAVPPPPTPFSSLVKPVPPPSHSPRCPGWCSHLSSQTCATAWTGSAVPPLLSLSPGAAVPRPGRYPAPSVITGSPCAVPVHPPGLSAGSPRASLLCQHLSPGE